MNVEGGTSELNWTSHNKDKLKGPHRLAYWTPSTGKAPVQIDREDGRDYVRMSVEGGTFELNWTRYEKDKLEGPRRLACWTADNAISVYNIVNIENGLVLTQDPDDNNVSNWGLVDDDPRQQWKFLKKNNSDIHMIINMSNEQGLGQHDGGRRDDKNNVTTWPGQYFEEPGWSWHLEAAGPAELVKLRLETVTCVKVSTGKDAGTKFLFQAIEAAVKFGAGVATGGASGAATTAAKQAAKIAYKQGAKAGAKAMLAAGKLVTRKAVKAKLKGSPARKFLKKQALQAGNALAEDDADSLTELAFDKLYGESPDNLEIRVNNISIWPNGGRDHRDIISQQTLPVNTTYIFERRHGLNIHLVEYDSGSGDDSLGLIDLPAEFLTNYDRYEDVIIRNDTEGSMYFITFRVDPI